MQKINRFSNEAGTPAVEALRPSGLRQIRTGKTGCQKIGARIDLFDDLRSSAHVWSDGNTRESAGEYRSRVRIALAEEGRTVPAPVQPQFQATDAAKDRRHVERAARHAVVLVT